MTKRLFFKKYLSFFRIRFTNGLQYRTAAYAGIATQFAWGAMTILMFAAFHRADSDAFPMTLAQTSTYLWLQQALLALFMPWFTDNDIFDLITSGNIAYELARPMDIYAMWFTKNLAARLSRAVLRCLPILVVAAFLPYPYGLSAPAGIGAFLMFLFTGVISFFTVVSYTMLIYIVTFYTLSSYGVRVIATSMTEFFTGGVIPLPFLPDGIRMIFEHTPFAAMQNIPLRVYSGHLAGAEMWYFAGLQLFWLAVMGGGGIIWMRSALRRVTVQGG